MNDLVTSLKQQLHSCETLMNVFQKERGILMQKTQVSSSDVIPIIKLKKRLMVSFEQQHKLINNLKQNRKSSKVEQETSKKLLSQLGRKLEQLLVIDRENELLMKNVINNGNSTAKPSRKNSYVNPHEMPAKISSTNRVFGGSTSRSSKKNGQIKDVSIRSFNPQRISVK